MPDSRVHYNRGIALDDLGRHEEVLAAYDRAVAIDPDVKESRLNRERLLEMMAE